MIDIHSAIFYIEKILPPFVLAVLVAEFVWSYTKKDNRYPLTDVTLNAINLPLLRQIVLVGHFFFQDAIIIIGLYFFGDIKTGVTWISLFSALLAADFLYYVFHIARHKFTALWYFHTVHHNGQNFNLSISFRKSWIEEVLHLFISNLILYICTPLSLESILIAEFIINRYIFLTHAFYVKPPQFLSYIFVLPQTHKIHHDQNEKHQNSNYGSMFSIWDRIFGTHIDSIDFTKYKAGVAEYTENNIIKLQIDPLVKLYKRYIL